MVTGHVNTDLEPSVSLTVRGPGGIDVLIEARVDTGFDGYLTLEPATVAILNLPIVGSTQVTLGDGTVAQIPVCDATVIWEGRPRSIRVECTVGHCLLGTALLDGKDLRIRFVPGGAVEIEAIP